jgi:RNA polymerase sigma-B factor
MATATGVGEDDVIEALEAGQGYRSGSLDVVGPEGDTLGERLGDDDQALEDAEQRAFLSPALDRLPARDRFIVKLRFVDGMTQSEIAKQVGMSQMHISRLLSRSLQTLRDALHETSPD